MLTILACLGVALVVGAQAAQAKVWQVNDTGDPGSPSGICSASDCTLRAAIGNAQNGDTVEVPAGDYLLDPGNGPLNVMRSFTIAGAGAGKVTIDGKDATKVFFIQADAVVTLKGVTVTRGNVGTSPGPGSDGGDIENRGTLNVVNSTIKNGSAFVGGDIYTTTNGGGLGVLNITDSTITGGTAAQFGGGIEYDVNTGGGTIEGTTISNNQLINSDSGGGGGVYDRSNGLEIINSTITGNSVNSVGFGGGLYDDDDFSLAIADTTIARNANAKASNIYFNLPAPVRPPALVSLNPGIKNTIVADPTGTGPNCAEIGTTAVSLGHNLEDDAAASCGFSTATNDLVGVSPKLGPLSKNGGPTRTMALQAGSPAINGGADVKGLNTDQRGAPRPQPQNGAPDIGAYEYGAIVDLGISETANHPVAVGHNLIYNLKATNNGPTQDGALGVRVATKLPSSVNFASSSPSGVCTNASGTVRCDLGTIAHGAAKHVRITVVPQKVGFPVDKSSVSSGARDPTPSNNRAKVTVAVQDKPAAQTKASSARTYHGATLHAKVNANNAQTVYHFEYGLTKSYGSNTRTGPAEGLSSIPVALSVAGLHPGRTYHYRIVATNAVGTSTGSDHTFFTYFLPVLHVSPARIRPGGRLRVYGNAGECPEGRTVTLLSPAFSRAHTYQGKGAIYTTVHHHGFFSKFTHIPSSRHRGTYPVSGLCGRFSSSRAGDPGAAASRTQAARRSPVFSGRLRLG